MGYQRKVHGSLELPHPTSNTITMKFLVVLSALLAVALAPPANVYSPYLLQDLAYNSVDANEDGQPDAAISLTHPFAYTYNFGAYTPFVAAPAAAVEVKTAEKPAEVKAVQVAAPFGYSPFGYGFYPFAAPTFGYSFATHA